MKEGEMGRWWGRKEQGKAGKGGGEIEGNRLGVGVSPLLLPCVSSILSHVPTAVRHGLKIRFISSFVFYLLPP